MVPDDQGYFGECEQEICLSGTSGMLNFVFTCYQSFIFSELSIKCTILSTAVKN